MQRLLLAVAISACCTHVLAQQTSNENPTDEIETVTVLGTKFNESLMDVPDSVAVVSALEIEREPIIDLYDVIERIPNVSAALGKKGFAIRGIDQRGIGGGGSGNTITTYVDDAPLGNQTTFFGPTGTWDVGQIEVYRGPQSTNFGRNALAGAIYIRTQDPSYESDFKTRIEAGEENTLQVSAAGGGSIVENQLAYRLVVDYRESDGFIDNTFLDEPADDTELFNARGKLLIEPVENLKIVTNTMYAENFAGEDLLQIGAGDNFVREAFYDEDGREGTETFLQSVHADWSISDSWELQSITTFQSSDYVRVEDFDVTPLPLAALDRTGTDEALSQELRLKFQGERLKAMVGTYVVDTERTFEDDFNVPATILNPALPASLTISRTSRSETNTNNFALFFDGSFDITDTIELVFGARYDNEETDSIASSDTQILPAIPPELEPFLGPLVGTASQSTDARFEAWLPKLGVQYSVADHTNLAVIIQRGYRAGGSEISVVDGSLIDYDPEFITNYEFSTRSQLLNNRLTLNTNVFYGDWTDQQVAIPFSADAPNLTRTINAGESELYGFEVATTFKASDTFDIWGALGYVKTEFKEFEEFTDNEFPFAPNVSANIGFDQRHRFGLFYGVDINYLSDRYSDNDNLAINELDEITLVNARVGYQFADHYTLTFYARNLFDEDYFTYLARVGDPDTASGTARVGDPRFIGLRLDAQF